MPNTGAITLKNIIAIQLIANIFSKVNYSKYHATWHLLEAILHR